MLTAREKEEGEWSWGVHHQACSLRPVLTRDTTMRELGKVATSLLLSFIVAIIVIDKRIHS